MNDLLAFATFVGEHVKRYLIDSFVEQGHDLSGKMKASIRYELINSASFSATVRFYMLSYGLVQDNGIKPERIPFGERESGAKQSEYIQGLIEFAMQRFRIGSDAAVSAAFAIARAHKREGLHTIKSARFSRTGERTDFINTALKRAIPNIKKEASKYVRLFLSFIVREYNGRVNSNVA
jgi:hypothetical protein